MGHCTLRPGTLVLCQGDSITDWGRSYENDSELGTGYVNFTAAWMNAKYPELGLKFINRGIGGNRICDLENRWSKDCIDLKPDLIALLIGVNDTWRRYDSDVVSPIPEFEACYRRLLDRVKKETSAKVIILEPFLLELPQFLGWREDLGPRIEAVRRVARDYGTPYIPLDGIFASVSTIQKPEYWAADGVHPTQAGHALIARHLMKVMKG
jgi:acyl-CoA thioesterase I